MIPYPTRRDRIRADRVAEAASVEKEWAARRGFPQRPGRHREVDPEAAKWEREFPERRYPDPVDRTEIVGGGGCE